jgi:hypothetical protein
MYMQHTVLEYDEHTIPFVDDVISSIIMCNTADNDSVGNASLATLEVFEVNGKDIKFCFHGLKIIPWNKTPAPICTVNTLGTIHSRRLYRIFLTQTPLVVSSTIMFAARSFPQGHL